MHEEPDWEKATKAAIVGEIARLLDVNPPPMSTGATEPRQIFVLANDHLGLDLDPRLGKPDMARGIVESVGEAWYPDYESRGATVTKRGLVAVLRTVQVLTAD